MATVLEESRRRGDAFTFEAALRALGRTASRKEWAEVGEQAAAAGQFRFAWRAFEKAGDKAGLEKVRLALAAEENPPVPSVQPFRGSGVGTVREFPMSVECGRWCRR